MGRYEFIAVYIVASQRELKRFGRKRKLALIEANNPSWRDLYEDFLLPRHWRRDD